MTTEALPILVKIVLILFLYDHNQLLVSAILAKVESNSGDSRKGGVWCKEIGLSLIRPGVLVNDVPCSISCAWVHSLVVKYCVLQKLL